jgi:hypothetical protein
MCKRLYNDEGETKKRKKRERGLTGKRRGDEQVSEGIRNVGSSNELSGSK